MKFLFSVVILSIYTGDILAGEKECQNRREDKLLEDRYNLEPKSPPVPAQLLPFTYDTPYGKIKTSDLFRDLAGNYCDSVNNHPAIYASSSGLTVVGAGYEKTYLIKEYQKAFNDYIKLLQSTGYKTR